MPYRKYYGLELEPFSNAPYSKYYFAAPEHTRALQKLLYAAKNSKGLAVLIGDPGLGKTMIARHLVQRLSKQEQGFETALLSLIHPDIDALWLLRRIAVQLGVKKTGQEKSELLADFYKRLIEIYKEGKRAVVVVDEAQLMGDKPELLTELRGWLNLEIPGRKLVTFVLTGLEDLDKQLASDPPLRQRVAIRVRLSKLDIESTGNYIRHRLKLSGAKRGIFSNEAIGRILHYSKGAPRLINTICDNVLFEGALVGAETIGEDLIEQIAEELGLKEMESEQNEAPPRAEESAASFAATDGNSPDAALQEIDRLLIETDKY